MPSANPKQHRFFEMVAHNPVAAKRVGVPQSVGKDFVHADEMTKAHALRRGKPTGAGDSSSAIGSAGG